MIGGAREVPRNCFQAAPGLRISVLCRSEVEGKVWDRKDLHRLLILDRATSREEWLGIARTIHEHDRIDAIVNFTESDADKTGYIAEKLGLRCYSEQTAQWVTDKYLMRARLGETGVDDTPARRVHGADELAQVAGELGYPVICKPAGGIGSRGISKLTSPADVPQAFTWSMEGTSGLDAEELIVEPFHQGREFSVECVSETGRHFVAGITQKSIDQNSFVEVGHLVPAPLPEAEAAAIADTVRRMLDALEIRDGATHTEVILTEDGVRIIETHLRYGGDRIPNMLAAATGIDIQKTWARQAVGHSITAEIEEAMKRHRSGERAEFAAIRYRCADRRGVLTAVHGIEEAQRMPGVAEVAAVAGVGEQVGDLTGSLARLAFAWALGATPEEAAERARAAVDSLTFDLDEEPERRP
ncbi:MULTISPECIES: ATP-grasp domain-containing protein [unclassified Streptomyces]|uniref:ATP-grasp domain-containing protein n=1 Tax=unclassified Streptomyces TaxID=2593676 RepID=UPI0003AA15C6|nr:MULTISPECIES: ATP-grasp domain-containing protein [unclassified Streptomyces]MYT33688.1 ATP-grasp domain-containing protein [Streptomyces sp. SID8354]